MPEMPVESVEISEWILDYLNKEYPPTSSDQKWKIDRFCDESEWSSIAGSLISFGEMSFAYSYENSPFQIEVGSVRDEKEEWSAFIFYKKGYRYDDQDHQFLYKSDFFNEWEDSIDQAISHFYEKQKLDFEKFYLKTKRANEVIQILKNSQEG